MGLNKAFQKINKHKKQAQHVVELALMMPIFVIVFSFIFQIMVETYAKYKFSYVFTGAVRTAISKQGIFDDLEEAKSYNFRETIENTLKAAMISARSIPFTDVQTGTIETNSIVYLIGAFQFVTKLLFFKEAGSEYFYFIVPVNKSFVEPLVLNKKGEDLENYFNAYYTYSTNISDTETETITEEETPNPEGEPSSEDETPGLEAIE